MSRRWRVVIWCILLTATMAGPYLLGVDGSATLLASSGTYAFAATGLLIGVWVTCYPGAAALFRRRAVWAACVLAGIVLLAFVLLLGFAELAVWLPSELPIARSLLEAHDAAVASGTADILGVARVVFPFERPLVCIAAFLCGVTSVRHSENPGTQAETPGAQVEIPCTQAGTPCAHAETPGAHAKEDAGQSGACSDRAGIPVSSAGAFGASVAPWCVMACAFLAGLLREAAWGALVSPLWGLVLLWGGLFEWARCMVRRPYLRPCIAAWCLGELALRVGTRFGLVAPAPGSGTAWLLLLVTVACLAVCVAAPLRMARRGHLDPVARTVGANEGPAQIAGANETPAQNVEAHEAPTQNTDDASQGKKPDGVGIDAPTLMPWERDRLEAIGVTAREFDVIEASLDGCSSVEAARRLGLQPSTVREYKRRACKKLEVDSFDQILGARLAGKAPFDPLIDGDPASGDPRDGFSSQDETKNLGDPEAWIVARSMPATSTIPTVSVASTARCMPATSSDPTVSTSSIVRALPTMQAASAVLRLAGCLALMLLLLMPLGTLPAFWNATWVVPYGCAAGIVARCVSDYLRRGRPGALRGSARDGLAPWAFALCAAACLGIRLSMEVGGTGFDAAHRTALFVAIAGLVYCGLAQLQRRNRWEWCRNTATARACVGVGIAVAACGCIGPHWHVVAGFCLLAYCAGSVLDRRDLANAGKNGSAGHDPTGSGSATHPALAASWFALAFTWEECWRGVRYVSLQDAGIPFLVALIALDAVVLWRQDRELRAPVAVTLACAVVACFVRGFAFGLIVGAVLLEFMAVRAQSGGRQRSAGATGGCDPWQPPALLGAAVGCCAAVYVANARGTDLLIHAVTRLPMGLDWPALCLFGGSLVVFLWRAALTLQVPAPEPAAMSPERLEGFLIGKGLTPNETRVCAALASGDSVAQIAEELAYSISAVNAMKRAGFAKLGVATRPQFTALLLAEFGPKQYDHSQSSR